FAEQSEQQVFGIELVVAQAKQQLLHPGESFANFVSKSFERDQARILPAARPPESDNLDSDIISVCVPYRLMLLQSTSHGARYEVFNAPPSGLIPNSGTVESCG